MQDKTKLAKITYSFTKRCYQLSVYAWWSLNETPVLPLACLKNKQSYFHISFKKWPPCFLAKKTLLFRTRWWRNFRFNRTKAFLGTDVVWTRKETPIFFFQGFFHKEAKNGSIVELFGFFFVPPVFAQSYFLAILGNFLSTFFGPISCLRKNVWPWMFFFSFG